ncbi:MAG: hypothetical protein P4N41_07480 [Negativicutes bacterium]|nr:hypothetical protein [Negativicutes bacterium]
MMKNVYDEVQYFYTLEVTEDAAISREWVEGFLRQKAWQGATDDELRDIWQNLKMFVLYLDNTDADYLEEIPYQEYSRVIHWLAGHVKGFKATLKPVRRFFAVLLEFYRHLALKKIVADTSELEFAAQEIAGGKKIKLVEDRGPILRKNAGALASEVDSVVGDIIEGLMVKLGTFFQKKEFNDDFQRALFLFAGPLNSIPDPEPGEFSMFWQEFWDYFLFDYHLLTNDLSPLRHFYGANRAELASEEAQILSDLLNAKFTVFTVYRVVNHDWIECINLFTEEKFRLPHPDFDYKAMKQMLFFGHVFAEDTVMVNYITSIELSANLRRRIKEEAVRQKAIFEIQQPEAGWGDFFSRHALAFRHTVDVLITLAKVNVTPFNQLGRTFPQGSEKRKPDERVSEMFVSLMPEYGFSLHDQRLAGRLWNDFSQLAKVTVRKTGAWAAAVIYVFAQINSPQGISAEQLAVDFEVSTSSVYANRDKIFKALELAKFDPRYLNEEGFIYSLFSS